MKFIYTFIITLFLLGNIYGQSNGRSGLIKYNTYISFMGGNAQKTTLYFNQQESYFDWNNVTDTKASTKKKATQKDNTSLDIKFSKTVESDSISLTNYKSFKKNEIQTRFRWIDGNSYVLKEKLPRIKWDISSEQKQISNFSCRKATTRFRGRNYTVWFTMQIPVSSGPWKLQGLPGMIIEAYDEKKEVWFGATEVIYSESYKELDPSVLIGPKIITIQEFALLQENIGDHLMNFTKFAKVTKSKMGRGSSVKVDVKKSFNFLEKEFEFELEDK